AYRLWHRLAAHLEMAPEVLIDCAAALAGGTVLVGLHFFDLSHHVAGRVERFAELEESYVGVPDTPVEEVSFGRVLRWRHGFDSLTEDGYLPQHFVESKLSARDAVDKAYLMDLLLAHCQAEIRLEHVQR